MTISEQLQSNFPGTISKEGEIFKAIVTDGKGGGAIDVILRDSKKYADEYINTPNIYEQTGDMLTKTISFFSYLERFANETEKAVKQRFAALFVRNHDKIWGTPYDVKNLFEQYFPTGTIYLVENTNYYREGNIDNENLLSDGDLEEQLVWTLTNCNYSQLARFSKSWGVELDNVNANLSQSVTINPEKKSYFLHFFMQGNLGVKISTQDGRFWNNTTKEWVLTDYINDFNSSEWDNKTLFFITDENITDITVEFVGSTSGVGYVDYIRLFQKKAYPSFTIIAHFFGDAAKGALGLAPGTNDDEPATQTKYKNYGYYDQAHITGIKTGFSQEIYEDLLKYVKAVGVKAYIEVVNKEQISGEE